MAASDAGGCRRAVPTHGKCQPTVTSQSFMTIRIVPNESIAEIVAYACLALL